MEQEGLGQFDQRVQDDVEGLLWLGGIEETIEFCGHRFVLKTLTMEEELAASVVSKEYVETVGQAKAWAMAQIALALQSVDGDEDFCPPISNDPITRARGRFQYISKWYWPVLEYLYIEYSNLLARQNESVKALENLSSRSLPGFTPSADSLTEAARSLAGEAEEDSTQPSS